MTLQPLPLPMSTDNLRRVIASFRGLKPVASISIKPDSVQVLDPRGALVFDAKRTGSFWTACAKPGLIHASFV